MLVITVARSACAQKYYLVSPANAIIQNLHPVLTTTIEMLRISEERGGHADDITVRVHFKARTAPHGEHTLALTDPKPIECVLPDRQNRKKEDHQQFQRY